MTETFQSEGRRRSGRVVIRVPVEIQGTAEGIPFSKSSLDSLLKLAEGGITDLINIQKRLIEEDALRY